MIHSLSLVLKGASLLADTCDACSALKTTTEHPSTTLEKVAAFSKIAITTLGVCSAGSEALNTSVEVQQAFNNLHAVATCIHPPSEIIDKTKRDVSHEEKPDARNVSPEEKPDARNTFFSTTSIPSQNELRSKVLQEKRYLAMSDQERAHTNRPIVEHGEIIGHKPVDREECKQLLKQHEKELLKVRALECLQKPQLLKTVTEASIALFQKFGEWYRQQRKERSEKGREDLSERDTIPVKFENDSILQRYICPITLAPIRHPAIDPHTKTLYERNALSAWVAEHGTSPLSRAPLNEDEILPAPDIAKIIEDRLGVLYQM